jgi:hypothetical protein
MIGGRHVNYAERKRLLEKNNYRGGACGCW